MQSKGFISGEDLALLLKPGATRIFTKNVFMGCSAKDLMGLNLNTIVLGASGAGKSFCYVMPNIRSCKTSVVILDRDGEYFNRDAAFLEENGYKIVKVDVDQDDVSSLDFSTIGDSLTAIFLVVMGYDKASKVRDVYDRVFNTFVLSRTVPYEYHVHFIFEEFANYSVPDNFIDILAQLKDKNASASIILQSLIQLKETRNSMSGIIRQCDALLYLGGHELLTTQILSNIVSERGGFGMVFDDIERIQPNEALLCLKGMPPCIDEKYKP